MLSSISSFIIFTFAQTEQTKSTRVFLFLDLRTDSHASFSKYFSTRWMSTISSSLTVSDILQIGKMSSLVKNRWPAMASLTASDVQREPRIILSFLMGLSLQNGSKLLWLSSFFSRQAKGFIFSRVSSWKIDNLTNFKNEFARQGHTSEKRTVRMNDWSKMQFLIGFSWPGQSDLTADLLWKNFDFNYGLILFSNELKYIRNEILCIRLKIFAKMMKLSLPSCNCHHKMVVLFTS